MSANLTGPCRFTAFLIFRIEDNGMSFGASSSEAGVAPEVNGSVPEIVV